MSKKLFSTDFSVLELKVQFIVTFIAVDYTSNTKVAGIWDSIEIITIPLGDEITEFKLYYESMFDKMSSRKSRQMLFVVVCSARCRRKRMQTNPNGLQRKM